MLNEIVVAAVVAFAAILVVWWFFVRKAAERITTQAQKEADRTLAAANRDAEAKLKEA